MKRIIPPILIIVILLGGFLAPFRMDVQSSDGETHSSSPFVVLEKSLAHAQNDPNDLASKENVLPDCGILSGEEFMGCIALLGYYGLFVPTSFLLGLLGQFLDYTLAYTIDSKSYSGTSFVSEGWGITRDLANILFIFILLYVAIRTILGLGKEGETKKLIGTVIVIALLINFSLFFSKVVIDSSNILARIFYNAIEVEGGGEYLGLSGEKAISVAIASKFDPQKLFDGVKDGMKITGDSEPAVVSGTAYAGYFLMVSIIATIINIIAIYVFFTVAILLIARTLGLWMVMVFAPFAFISYIVPKIEIGGGLSDFGHQKWWGELLSLSFLAPIFLFFLYLIVMFLETGFIKSLFGGSSTIQTMLGIIIPLAIVAMLLIKAKDMAKKMAGEAGKATMSVVKTIGAVALGGAALAGGAAAGLAARGGAMAVRGAARMPRNLMARKIRAARAGGAGTGITGSYTKGGVKMLVHGGPSITDSYTKGGIKMLKHATPSPGGATAAVPAWLKRVSKITAPVARIKPAKIGKAVTTTVREKIITRPVEIVTGLKPQMSFQAGMIDLMKTLREAGDVKASNVKKSVGGK